MLCRVSAHQILPMSEKQILATVGSASDREVFSEYIQKNLRLYELENQIHMSTFGLANFIRKELAIALRRAPYQTNLLLGGTDDSEGPALFWIDYLATLQKVKFGAHGYGAFFVLSILDKEWKEDLTEEEALDVLRKCIAEIHTRLALAAPEWTVKVVDSNGIRVVEL
eukprot:scaffold520_cov224-Pinguiococcus_pyrenoidosus.AAC.4